MRDLIRALEGKRRDLEAAAPRIADHLADILVAELNARVPGAEKHPNATGNLKRAITEKTAPYQVGDRWAVGVGNLNLLGRPNEQPPRGTIWDFLLGDDEDEDDVGAYGRAYEERQRAKAEVNRQAIESVQQNIEQINAQLDALGVQELDLVDSLEALTEEARRLRRNRSMMVRLSEDVEEAFRIKIAALASRVRAIEAQLVSIRARQSALQDQINLMEQYIKRIRQGWSTQRIRDEGLW